MLFKRLGILIILFLSTAVIYAQEDVLVLDPLQDVAAQIVADTTTNNGIPPNRVYELQRDEFYLQTALFNVPAGDTIRFRGAAGTGTKPVLYLDEVPGTGRPPGNWMVLNGGNIEVKDMCVVGYFEDLWDEGLAGIQGGLIQTGAVGSTIILDNVILSNVNGNLVRTNATTAKVQITNSIFANMGALTRSNLGAGKGIDLREVAHDTVIFVNNTFVNFQDRAIRHLDLGTGTPGAINYLQVDHNTFINGMAFHGLLSLGSLGDQAIITNNLFVDAFALGEDSTDATRRAEWLNTGETYPSGSPRMTWVLSVPNDVTQWTVSNNVYVVSPEGQAWLDEDHFGFGPFGVGTPLSWHINSKLGADSSTAFVQDSLTLNNRPNLMTNMMTWYEDPTGGNRSKNTPGTVFDPLTDDYDRRKVEYYRDTLDAAYPTTALAYTAGENCFPAGDLNWFPDKKTEWENGTGQCIPPLIVVDGQKDDFYTALQGPNDGYLQIRWYAGNTNGFPDPDDVDLSAKVWTAWDSDWFYFYEEVMDDTLSNDGTTNVWEIDNMELKFDAQPYTTANSIWDTRLTAPGLTPNDTLNLVAGADKQFARQLITGGYALELAIKWTAIGHNIPERNESITPAVDSIFGLAINSHDNDGHGRQASVTWAAVMDDHVWDTPADLGTVKLLADNKLQFIPRNNITGVYNPIPYDGRDTVVGVNSLPAVPAQFSLSQNYPNPFNPSTTIRFALPKQAAVELAVYNLLGEKVVELINSEMPAGYHQTAFNAGSLSSGVYFYRLSAGSFVQTRKLMILK